MTEPVGDTGPTSFVDSLGDRGQRRAEPRASIAVAGAGCALGVVGVLVIAGDTGIDESSGDFNRVPGILLTAFVVVAGYAVLANVRRGALATAGAVAAATGVPPLLFFLTFDANDLPPYSTEGILLVSTGAWLVSYAVGPARGRPFFLGAGLLGVWLSLLQLTEKVFSSPFDAFMTFSDAGGSATFDPETGELIEGDTFGSVAASPDPTTVGLISLGLGIGFVLAGRWLDRRGHHGAATPFAVAGLPCLAVGIGALAPDLEAAGTGLLMLVIGLALAYHGASVWRRATTWLGAATMATGAAVFLLDMSPEDDATVGGMLLLAGGIAMVGAGHVLARALQEPEEMVVTLGLAEAVAATGPRHQISSALPAPPPPPEPEPDASVWAPPPAPPAATTTPPPEPEPDPSIWAPPPPEAPDEPPTPPS